MDGAEKVGRAELLMRRAGPLVIGHRGCCAIAPENTLASFQRAIDDGADLVEFDFHFSRDGVPVVIHDDTLDRTTNACRRWRGSGFKVCETDNADLEKLDAGSWFDRRFARERIPTLAGATQFIHASGSTPLAEHKSGDAETCAQFLRKHGWVNELVLISFDWAWLRRLHELDPDQILGALGPPTRLANGRIPSGIPKPLSQQWLDEMKSTGARLAVWNRKTPTDAIRLAHNRGLRVWVYTINNPRLAINLINAGVDGIITNDAKRIRDRIQSQGTT